MTVLRTSLISKTCVTSSQYHPLLRGWACQHQGRPANRGAEGLQKHEIRSLGIASSIVSTTPTPPTSPHSNPFIVRIGSRLLEIPHSALLYNFWGDGLNSPCMVCNEPFNDDTGPPIRTTSIDREEQENESNPQKQCLRIHNRHLECIDAKQWAKIVPISHAWHEAVAVANESQRSTTAAIDLVIDTPYRALDAVRRRFGADSEAWHDYVSVPQWKIGTQQQLLHALPLIFSKPRRAVVHLEDVSSVVIQKIAQTSFATPAPLETIAQYMHSDWYQRMWVCLECTSSKRVYLLSKENNVASHFFRSMEGRMVGHVGTHMRSLDRETFLAECKRLDLDHLSIGSLSNIQRIRAKLTLGAVYVIIAGKQCRTYRDRFVAACSFLNIGSYREVSAQLPRGQIEACLWLSHKCLDQGDYTPLLLAPSSAGDEPEIPGARWMKGHKQMSVSTWRLGRITKAAKDSVILRQGKVMPKLELVGNITKWEYFTFTGDATERFTYILDWLLAATDASADKILLTMPRIYHFHSWKHKTGPRTTKSFNALLQQFKVANWADNHEKRSEIVTSIISLLRLSECVVSGRSSLLHYTAVMEKRFFVDKHALVIAHCPTCHESALQRVALWQAPKGQAKLYRIPGLSFWRTLPNGVGLVMDGTKTVGRMIYGTPTCGCHNLELVEVN